MGKPGTVRVEFPSQRWVKAAFEKLVEFKFALPPSDGSDTYQILFRTPRGDILKRFIELDLGKGAADEASEKYLLALPRLER